mgnify:CR=1 FL=1
MGTPGVGKTTLAQIISNKLEAPFYTLSAISSGVKDVREVIEKAKGNRFFNTVSPILFIDEIHRFSKSQQDSPAQCCRDRCGNLDRSHDRESLVRGHPSVAFPLPGICFEIIGES